MTTMKTKRNSMFKLLVSIAMVIMLSLSMALPAFAAGDPITGTEDSPAKAGITKLFQMPVGTKTPEFTFTFNITPKSVDGSELEAALADAPPVGPKQLKFEESDEFEIIGTGTSAYKLVLKQTGDIFAAADWKHAGLYVYTVTEVQGPFTNTFEEKMTFSEAEYELHVYVVQKADNSGYYVQMIADYIIKRDDSNEGVIGDKVDPTPGGADGNGHSEMVFTNVYVKNNGGTQPSDTVLKLSKDIAGELGNKTLLFDFNVTVTKPHLVSDEAKYIAYVMDGSGVVADITKNAPAASIKPDGSGRSYIEFNSGATLKVSLMHGQWLSFINTPVGTNIVVEEAASANYLPSYTVTLHEKVEVEETGTKGSALGFGGAPDFDYIGEGLNIAAFVNTYDLTTPTGISVDDLPYIVLISLVVASLVGFALVKSRKKAR